MQPTVRRLGRLCRPSPPDSALNNSPPPSNHKSPDQPKKDRVPPKTIQLRRTTQPDFLPARSATLANNIEDGPDFGKHPTTADVLQLIAESQRATH
ncbi:hypothetical protein PtA15_7A815 [Puccinia triticina]|uniref:Uncharacterized protein n=1 Tax=Puccinia triticina TaxID=208348 RepID=A0ABY7CPX2_9BASI|nr:uncharacterized protein PtA15_7A815 [Puccinia triticina]WAQ87085.1 hypothetical protein PtA15_7A815 [Puccinia triticina]